MATRPALYALPFLIFKRGDKKITGTSWDQSCLGVVLALQALIDSQKSHF